MCLLWLSVSSPADILLFAVPPVYEKNKVRVQPFVLGLRECIG